MTTPADAFVNTTRHHDHGKHNILGYDAAEPEPALRPRSLRTMRPKSICAYNTGPEQNTDGLQHLFQSKNTIVLHIFFKNMALLDVSPNVIWILTWFC